ncbi:SusC/RagA family TonB-linked outer membrane protein [Flavobacterium silvaticum]|uniref:TonB-dependent receptor n=1 Tax=Flavobacterium silvaticum TaxID=1852020 RepID=A0A972FMV4_9FLAO|nr:TonB-dependent receptor [Flavobacterium silvaticum]NMH28623.1 TonB-dependent receptor [Flavobacterium silvaticum]
MMNFTRLLKSAGDWSVLRSVFFVLFLLGAGAVSAQEIKISGTVLAKDNNMPLPMANVVVKGGKGVSTDIDGKYEISAKSTDVLVFSYIGYQEIEEPINGRTSIDVSLNPDANTLNDVIVVGYTTARKQDLTGAVGVVDVANSKKTITYDVAKMLQGQVAGVTVQSSGEPGGFVNIQIRGASSFTNNNPVYVVDGIILDAPFDLAPSDIESMSILKDASATAIYGVRGAAGVVLITTKKGKAGKLKVSVNSLVGFQNVTRKWDVTDREGYQKITNAAVANNNEGLIPGNDPSSPSYISDVDTNWQDEAFRTGRIENQQFNVSGGSESATFSMNIDHYKNSSYFNTPQDYERYSTNLNVTGKLGRFKYGAKVAYTQSNKNSFYEYLVGGSPIIHLLQAIPTMPVYDPNRLGGYGGADNATQRAITLNVIGFNNLNKQVGDRDRFVANAWGEYEIIKGLRYTFRVSADHLSYGNRTFVPPSDLGWYYITTNDEASLDVDNGTVQRTIVDNMLNYDITLDKHKVAAFVGLVNERNDSYRHYSRGVGFVPGEIAQLQYADSQSAGEYETVETRKSFVAHLDYSYDDRYFLTGNFRQDRTSLFREDINTGNFYSVSGAWKINNDVKLPDWWDGLKLRAGYGTAGNNAISVYKFSPTVNAFSSYDFNNVLAPGTATQSILDPDISWETTNTVNAALEMGFFKNKLQVTAEYFVKTSDDILIDLPLPSSTGSLGNLITTNGAKMRNKGWEFTAGWQDRDNAFKWGVSGNVSLIDNEVLAIKDNYPVSLGVSRTEVGRSAGEIYAWEVEGIFQSQEEINQHAVQPNAVPGDIKFRDVNGDGQITDNDRTFQGRTIPKYTYGVNFNADWKNIDFSFFFQGSGGNKIYNGTYNALMIEGLVNHHTDALNFWTPENTDTNVPRPDYLEKNQNARTSSRFIQSGNYLKLQNIELGYTLPLLTKVIEKARVYVSGQNMFVITKFKGYDPDFRQPNSTNPGQAVLNRGFEYGSFPNPRTIVFGVNLNF